MLTKIKERYLANRTEWDKKYKFAFLRDLVLLDPDAKSVNISERLRNIVSRRKSGKYQVVLFGLLKVPEDFTEEEQDLYDKLIHATAVAEDKNYSEINVERDGEKAYGFWITPDLEDPNFDQTCVAICFTNL